MPFTPGYSAAEAQLLILLSKFAYIDSDPLPDETIAAQEARMRADIDAALAASPYPTWRVVWGPGLSGGRANMLYVAGETSTNQLAVAIRGTDWSFWLDWIEDFGSLLPLVPFTAVVPSIPAGNPLIAAGTHLGLQLLLNTEAQGMDLATFLRQAGTETFVTGHSLGGCLASVLAPALVPHLGTASKLKVYTFAAPSAGNQDFADYYRRLFTDDAYRVYNDIDVVPLSWASLLDIGALYTPAPTCTEAIKSVIDRAQAYVAGDYRQVGIDVPLHGQVIDVAPDIPPNAQFFAELDHQHATETYSQLLAAPRLPLVEAKLQAVRARLSSTLHAPDAPADGA